MVEYARTPARLQTLWPFSLLGKEDFMETLEHIRPVVIEGFTTFVKYPNNPCAALYLVVHGEVKP
eukprot:123439-Prorocentrum_minimum.AAC.3